MGLFFALSIIIIWGAHLFYTLQYVNIDFTSPLFYVHVIFQTWIYTGLFITGHDAMHRTVSKNAIANKTIGTIAVALYAGMSYRKLIKNHWEHHKFPGTKYDPDFSVKYQNFWIWWSIFMYKYITISQLIIMAVGYNLLAYFFPEKSVVFFWLIPAFLSTLQLFYFGTYRPHRYPHSEKMKPHNARTQKLNHLWALISCYFFGYHNEHHCYPGTPWWKLYKVKEQKQTAQKDD